MKTKESITSKKNRISVIEGPQNMIMCLRGIQQFIIAIISIDDHGLRTRPYIGISNQVIAKGPDSRGLHFQAKFTFDEREWMQVFRRVRNQCRFCPSEIGFKYLMISDLCGGRLVKNAKLLEQFRNIVHVSGSRDLHLGNADKKRKINPSGVTHTQHPKAYPGNSKAATWRGL